MAEEKPTTPQTDPKTDPKADPKAAPKASTGTSKDPLYPLDPKTEALMIFLDDKKLIPAIDMNEFKLINPARPDYHIVRTENENNFLTAKVIKIEQMPGSQIRQAYMIWNGYLERKHLDADAKKLMEEAIVKYPYYSAHKDTSTADLIEVLEIEPKERDDIRKAYVKLKAAPETPETKKQDEFFRHKVLRLTVIAQADNDSSGSWRAQRLIYLGKKKQAEEAAAKAAKEKEKEIKPVSGEKPGEKPSEKVEKPAGNEAEKPVTGTGKQSMLSPEMLELQNIENLRTLDAIKQAGTMLAEAMHLGEPSSSLSFAKATIAASGKKNGGKAA